MTVHKALTRRMALGVAVSIALTMPALAFQATKFTPSALTDAQKSGKPVLVDVTAPWCPTCKAQKPVLDTLLGSDKFKSFSVLDVDFDTQKPDLQALGVRMQSTLIVYKGGHEVGRSTGVTDRAAIEALLAKAL